jgi:hypothetical protein
VIDPAEEHDDAHLTLRTGGPEGTTPYALARVEAAGMTQVLLAVLRPDIGRTRIASHWAQALGLSPEGSAFARLMVDEHEPWGPAEMITPAVDETLDDDITDDGAGGLLLGNDFLHTIWVMFMGELRLVVLTKPGA